MEVSGHQKFLCIYPQQIKNPIQRYWTYKKKQKTNKLTKKTEKLCGKNMCFFLLKLDKTLLVGAIARCWHPPEHLEVAECTVWRAAAGYKSRTEQAFSAEPQRRRGPDGAATRSHLWSPELQPLPGSHMLSVQVPEPVEKHHKWGHNQMPFVWGE